MSDFIDGINMFNKRDNAPDFVLGDLSIDPAKLKSWCENTAPSLAKPSNDGISRVRAQILLSKEGRPYIKINNYTPDPQPQQSQGSEFTVSGDEQEIPF
jgi:hypothetical protein